MSSWADNRFVHVSFSGNPQNICDKPIVSDIQSFEYNVCVDFVSRKKFITAFVRNNDLFSTLPVSRLGLKMSLFLTQAAMNFVLERQNGRKRSIVPQCMELHRKQKNL